jgi:membrane protease subunit (stomatin/prohibitin family)
MARIIDVVEFLDESGREIIHREPPDGPGDFRLGSQVIVRESQVAVFFRDGRALDTFGPGRHTLQTYNLPILSGLIGLATNGKTPFPAEVVFVNLRQFIDQKWGTPEPITLRDPSLGMARLRAFGSYAYQVANPSQFVNQIAGTQGIFTTAGLADYLRNIIIQRFTDVLGTQQRSLLDLASQYGEVALSTGGQLRDDFAAIGLTLSAFYVTAITPTEETAKAIDERAAMGAIGDMDAYMKFKSARAIGDAANNPSGNAGAGVGLGAGIGLGAGLAGMVGQAFQNTQQQAAPPAAQPVAPAAAAPAANAPLTREQVQQAIDNLDLRFSNGEISEENYNRLLQKWQERLKTMGG